MTPKEVAYTPIRGFPGGMPFLEIELDHEGRRTSIAGLVDSGSALNILPFDVGAALGLDWESQDFPLALGGTLRGVAAYAVLVKTQIAQFPAVHPAFAWLERTSSEVPVLLVRIRE